MTSSPLVLIVEDSKTQAEQLAAQLAEHGLEVVVAGDGPEGLRAVDQYCPNLIVLDINLPTMDGFQICRRLKRDPNTANIPVIMLTSRENFESMMEGLETGADDYIPKDTYACRNLLSSMRAFGVLTDGG
jgi:DNA-binding response OmpR family regulator